MVETLHIQPTATLAERVLLPGDPGRAFRLAQELLDGPKMFNHHRGLWGYTGIAADGEPLTIQSTGMGGPSSAIVVSELIALGAERLVRIGTCGGLDSSLQLGQLVIVTEAIGDDGTSHSLSGIRRQPADPGLLQALGAAAESVEDLGAVSFGSIVSSDLFYDADDRVAGWIRAGSLAVEMETATIFALAVRRHVRAASVVLVSNMVVGDAVGYLEAEALHAAEVRLGRLGVAALS